MKYLLQSKNIKNATKQYNARVISIWKFMQIVSYSTSRYLNQQVNWVNEVDLDPESEMETAQELPPPPQLPTTESQESVCMVCMFNTTAQNRQIVTVPCGHAWICNIYIENLQTPTICPRCKMFRSRDYLFKAHRIECVCYNFRFFLFTHCKY